MMQTPGPGQDVKQRRGRVSCDLCRRMKVPYSLLFRISSDLFGKTRLLGRKVAALCTLPSESTTLGYVNNTGVPYRSNATETGPNRARIADHEMQTVSLRRQKEHPRGLKGIVLEAELLW